MKLETFTEDMKIQPFISSVSTSPVLMLNFLFHLGAGVMFDDMQGHCDPNFQNLVITNTFPFLSQRTRRIPRLTTLSMCIMTSLHELYDQVYFE